MSRRIEYLDALRGFAALAVLFQHIAERILFSPAGQGLPHALGFVTWGFNFGRFGVALFFLISGFVIPFSFKGKRPLEGFVISRFFRLYPAYWISLVVALLCYATVPAPGPTVKILAANITMFQHFFGQPDIVHVYWTLAIELLFYMLCAALFAVGRLFDARVLALVVVAFLLLALTLAGATSMTGHHLPANIATNLAFMFAGTLMRRAWLDDDALARRLIAWAIAACVLAVPAVQALSYAETVPGEVQISPASFVAAYLVALVTFVFCVRRRIDFGKTAAWFGAISYSLYLFHGPMMTLFYRLLEPGVRLGGLWYAVLVTATTLVISALVYYGAERTFVTLGHRVMQRRGLRAASKPAQPL